MIKILLLFDIDGTLLQVDDATRQAINKTFAEIFNLNDPRQNVAFQGRTDLAIFRDVALALLGRPITDREMRQVVARYLELLPGELERCPFRVMPGITELLFVLAARKDIILGLEPAAYLKLERAGIDSHFPVGGFGSDSEDRTELIRVAIARARSLDHHTIPDRNIFVIGDSPHDIAAGRKAGVNTIAVGTGSIPADKLLAESPMCLLPDLSDVTFFLSCVGC
jgi:phosphoglycolate phosphatase